jgi:tetratricopeptide (TPR) repeat protein
LIRCLLNLSTQKYVENRENLAALEKYFLESGNDYLKGDFYNHLGLAEKGLGDLEQALRCFEMSRHYHQRSGHSIYQGTAANNIAQVYKMLRNFPLAHSGIDHATRLFRQAKDRPREGFSYDTKALIYLEERKYDDALKAVEKGIAVLRRSENSGYLAETILTKAVVEIFLNEKLTPAMLTLIEAVNIARQMTDEKRAERFVREFEEAVERKRSQAPVSGRPSTPAKGDLRLVLPPALAHHTDCHGIWINNSYLEKAGLWQGSLAVVVNETVRRGDLVAVADGSTGEISCGFYDFEFGIIGLHGPDSEPLVFNEGTVEILGKIVGVADPAKEKGGKMMVEPIKT